MFAGPRSGSAALPIGRLELSRWLVGPFLEISLLQGRGVGLCPRGPGDEREEKDARLSSSTPTCRHFDSIGRHPSEAQLYCRAHHVGMVVAVDVAQVVGALNHSRLEPLLLKIFGPECRGHQ